MMVTPNKMFTKIDILEMDYIGSKFKVVLWI